MRAKIIFCSLLVAVISLVLYTFGTVANADTANFFLGLGMFSLGILGFVIIPSSQNKGTK